MTKSWFDPANVSLPLVITAAALLLSTVGSTVQLLEQRQALAAASDAQRRASEDGDLARTQLNGLLAGAGGLAQNGDGAAKSAMDAMARQGITYTPPGAAAPTK
jgi:CO/xanthine dehydrogenase Mo-binding subunit